MSELGTGDPEGDHPEPALEWRQTDPELDVKAEGHLRDA